ncbi:type VI secretion system protein, partial [Acinetobacter baumannii]
PSKALSSLQGFMEGYTQGLESSSDTKQQEQGKIFRQALMLLASPNGIALTTPENIILQASQDIAESASGSINLSAQKNIIGHAQDKISLFAAQKGLRAYAAKGKLELQAQDDAIEAIAKKVIKLISTEDKIELTSPKEIVLTAGGSQLKINANGVFSTTGGKFESKAGQHLFTGGAKVSMKLPHLPVIQEGGFSQLFDLKDLSKDNPNLIGAPYKILLKKTGDILMVGTINDDLQTERVFTKEEEEIELILFETNYTDFNIENLDYLFGEE